MKIVGMYSFKDGQSYVFSNYPKLIDEIMSVISQIDAPKYKTKVSKEKTMAGKMLYAPTRLNSAFKKEMSKLKWTAHKEQCTYSDQFYVNGYTPTPTTSNMSPFREMDFVKETLGVEVQFGKYAFMVYNVCAKMTIFHNLGIIKAGIEIVPVKSFAQEMSTGVSYFEQIVWDLEKRGSSDIDIPVLVLGIDV